MTSTPTTDATTRRTAPTLIGIVLVNAALQTLLILPPGFGLVPTLCAIASLLVMIGAAVLATRTIGNTMPSTPRQGSALRRAGDTVRTYPWRFIRILLGTAVLAALCWLVALLTIAFLPGPVAIFITWIVIGLVAWLLIRWWVRLSRSATPR